MANAHRRDEDALTHLDVVVVTSDTLSHGTTAAFLNTEVTGWGNAGGFNTGFWNSGETNTGWGNSGNLNTGFGSVTDQTVPNSGFGTTGMNISGFFNSASGGTAVNGNMSGIGNTASGGSLIDGDISGFFNTGVTGAFPPFPSGVASGVLSGAFNRGTAMSSVFSIESLLKQLMP